MKKRYVIGSILGVLVLLMVFLNPGQDRYVSWVADRLTEEKGILVNIGVDYVAKPIIDTSTTKKDFFFFTVYHTNLLTDKDMITLGIMNQFVPIKSIAFEK
ncbi:hypothetical protein JOC85_002165 [Bacillus mesophilus]|uniref:DUF4359 domain-containing protein n=1 Tax=Bacillus mesophilus TaxID=1808955 RepID=A0A6M0Q6R6_9BACI|nr:DUF4359 domain-containing protein [Bacillus mesophilus]MBM7661362.1 hypothetical protein [Bacillus mesophilus]NEY72035.1 DUF4359 domain-containing protein [Bacillus mesophilus]